MKLIGFFIGLLLAIGISVFLGHWLWPFIEIEWKVAHEPDTNFFTHLIATISWVYWGGLWIIVATPILGVLQVLAKIAR
jgi:hypothetical protein